MSTATEFSLGPITLEFRHGNIALLNVDAIVNAANEHLGFGAGVAGAILQEGGDKIQKECNEIGFCETGSAVITSGGLLKAKYVIHAVGPMLGEGNEGSKLSAAVKKSLALAEENGVHTIAFPAISAGLFHYPLSECASTMVGAIKEAAPSLKNVNRIVICLHDEKKLDTFKEAAGL
ncbi:MAG TPA: macro domain-containing protein [Candidatus Kapabacteria bacterium]|nr:macro domain-containing protein [Candidatus Kapabacteria bacterium]